MCIKHKWAYSGTEDGKAERSCSKCGLYQIWYDRMRGWLTCVKWAIAAKDHNSGWRKTADILPANGSPVLMYRKNEKLPECYEVGIVSLSGWYLVNAYNGELVFTDPPLMWSYIESPTTEVAK